MPLNTDGQATAAAECLGTLIVDERRYDVTAIRLDGGQFAVEARHTAAQPMTVPAMSQGVLFGPDGVQVVSLLLDLGRHLHADRGAQVVLVVRVSVQIVGAGAWPVHA